MENTINPENQLENEKPQRPQFLTVLCILSFIWSGFIIFCLFMGICFSGFIFRAAESILAGAEGMPAMSESQLKPCKL